MGSRVRVYLGCSLDGFIAGPNDDISFLHEYGVEAADDAPPSGLDFDGFMADVGALLMGRKTYEVAAGFGGPWPYGEHPVLVATHRDLTPKVPTVRAVQGSIAELVEQAREAADGKDIYLDGGDLVRQALDACLVDELCLTMLPVILGGEGVRLFDGLLRTTPLELVSHHDFGQGMVQITARPRY